MSLKLRIWAIEEILKRYLVFRSDNIIAYEKDGVKKYYNKQLGLTKEEQEARIQECINICSSLGTSPESKKAARILLDAFIGKENANNALDKVAVVVDRGDRLVRKWRIKVLKRHEECAHCGGTDNLQAHHISHWSDDPLNRINVDNGIALCVECHSKEHPGLSNLIMSRTN